MCRFNLTNIFIFLFSGEIAIEFKDFRLNGVDLGQNADCLTSDHLVVEQKIRNLGWRQVRSVFFYELTHSPDSDCES
jgi:hypothetical protein